MQKFEIGSPQDFFWIDLQDPKKEELEHIAQQFNLHPTSVQDCLDPEHFPKFEKIDDLHFVILRAFDENSKSDADTIQELTRKVALFYTDKFLITVHRGQQAYIDKTREKWKTQALNHHSIGKIIFEIFQGALNSYEKSFDAALVTLEHLEMSIFEASGAKKFNLKDGYLLKRKTFIFRRMIRSLLDLIHRVHFGAEVQAPQIQSLKEDAESSLVYAEELTESTNILLNMHISLSSQKTNEVMRILTILSLFLLPLNVVTGIYGMNFEHMPELKWEYGYPMALAFMISISTVVFIWFHKKGWLKAQ